jgi:hypothetical protein
MTALAAPLPSLGAADRPAVRWTCALLAVGLTALVYYPITANYFHGDDFLNLYYAVNDGGLEFLVRPHGGHMLVARNALLRLSYDVAGPEPVFFFWTVLLTHLLNVALLFQVIVRLTDRAVLAGLGAAAWGSAPVQEGALGWYSVYGHVVAGTCLLAVLAGLARVASGRPAARWRAPLWAALILIGSTSFGVGIGVALVLPVAAWLLVAGAPGRGRIVAWLAGSAVLVPALYFTLQWVHVHVYDGNASALPLLMAGLDYVGAIASLMLNLFGFGIASLLSGMLYRPTLYPGPIGYALLAAYALALAIALARGPQAVRRQILAALLLAAGCYGMIASGRGWLFNDAARLSMIRSERFQYVGTAMLSLALCVALARIVGRSRTAVGIGLLAAWVIGSVVVWARLRPPINHFLYARRESAQVVAGLRQRLAAAPAGADVYIDNQPFRSVGELLLSPTLFPGSAGVFAIFFPENVVDGRRVFFVVPEVDALPLARRGRRATSLLVAPGERPTPGTPP